MTLQVRVKGTALRDLLRSRELRRYLRGRAERVRARAEATAPRDTGAFAGSFQVEDATTDRAVGRVITTDPAGLAKEARFRTMTRALLGVNDPTESSEPVR